jgi:hypothetical protein
MLGKRRTAMKRSITIISIYLSVCSFLLLLNFSFAYAQTEIPAGNVSGSWTLSNSPYHINGEVAIPDGETLNIEPGVDVIFTGHYKFNVQGRLLAIGTVDDSITFTAQNPDTGWHGIRLVNIATANDSTIFERCIFQYGKANSGDGMENRGGGAIFTSLNKLRISHCLFQNNLSYHPDENQTGGGAIAITAGNPIIEYCDFTANTSPFGAAMIIWYSTSAQIRNNHFHNNNGHGTINIGAGAAPLLINNLIDNNYSTVHGNIHFSNSIGKAVLINNTIVNNTCAGGGAIYVNDASAPLFINNIIYGNEPAQVYLESPAGLDFINCLIEGGRGGFTEAITGNFIGTYEYCLDTNPVFVGANDFHLQNSSPCIGIGVSSSSGYNAPNFDFEGNSRPAAVDPLADIGAYESDYAAPAFSLSFTLSHSFIFLGSGTIHLISKIFNYHQQDIQVFSKIYSSEGSSQDSVELFDDGQHGDSLDGDGIYATDYQANVEDILTPSLVVYNNNLRVDYGGNQKFTTIGPLVYKGYNITTPGDKHIDPGETHRIKLEIQNLSQNATAANISARITSLDTFATVISNNFAFGNIPAGRAVLSSLSRQIQFSQNFPGPIDTVRFAVEISSNGYIFWRDSTFKVVVDIELKQPAIPLDYSLDQNYPNPFNPVTTISFCIPVQEQVQIHVFDCLGRKVRTLLNDELPAGLHQVLFDASGLASGIYFYQLRSAGFCSSQKCLLVK